MTIDLPAVNGFVGPGFTVYVSGMQGPTAVNDKVVVSVHVEGNELESVIWGCRLAEGLTFSSLQVGSDQGCGIAGPVSGQTPGQGDPVRIYVEHQNAAGQRIESVSQAAKWDGAGQLWRYGDAHAWGGGQVTGGFTSADRTTLGEVKSAVYRPWPGA